jgi:hypothetical protein
MDNAATPAVPNNGTPPVVPAATPASITPELVTLTKEAHDQLLRDAARGASNQRKADLYDRMNGSKGNRHFTPTAPVTPPTNEEQEAAAIEEDRKAEQGLIRLALDPAYRQVFDSDPTLRELFMKNPLAILPVFAPDALDAEDAINLVKETLDKRKAPAIPPAQAEPVTPPATPPAGGINPQGSDTPNADVEAARKLTNTEDAIAGMISAKMKAGKK